MMNYLRNLLIQISGLGVALFTKTVIEIKEKIKSLEKENLSLSEVYKKFSDIFHYIQNSQMISSCKLFLEYLVDERWMLMGSDLHRLGFMLDMRYYGLVVSREENYRGVQAAEKLCEKLELNTTKIKSEFLLFLNRERTYADKRWEKKNFKNSSDVRDLWRMEDSFNKGIFFTFYSNVIIFFIQRRIGDLGLRGLLLLGVI